MRLGELKPGDKARVVAIESEGDAADFAARLMEMGMLEGSLIELMHEAPFGGDPVAVRVRGALIALRRGEANQVWVERV